MHDNPLIGDHIEPGYLPHPKHLTTEAYGEVLDSIVVACVDMVLTNNAGQMLIGKRAWHPQADWWVIGGRMKTGESLEQSAIRNLSRETGLQLAPDRFRYLTTMSNAWKLRRHAPAENGTHTLSVVLTAALSPAEAEAIKLDEEYSDQQWLDPREVASNTKFHPGLRQCARAIQLQK